MVLDVILIITPIKGKEERLVELMKQQVDIIERDEPDLLIDRIYKRVDNDGHTEYVAFQRYKDEEAYKAHFQTEHYKSMPERLQGEEVSKPMVYMKLEPLDFGFER